MKLNRRSFLKALTGAAAAVTAGAAGIANAFDGMGFEHLAKPSKGNLSDLKFTMGEAKYSANFEEPEVGFTYVGRPLKAITGDLYLDVKDLKYYIYDGSKWVVVTTGVLAPTEFKASRTCTYCGTSGVASKNCTNCGGVV